MIEWLTTTLAQSPGADPFPYAEIVGTGTLAAMAFAAVVRILTKDRNEQGVVNEWKAVAKEREAERDTAREELKEALKNNGILQESLRREQEKADSYHRRLSRRGLLTEDATDEDGAT